MTKWEIDPAHSSANFSIQHLGFAKVSGTIFGVGGNIAFDPENPNDAEFNGVLDVKTLTTGVEQRDGHLKSDDFFDVENYPEITFTSKSVEASEDTAKIRGDLTIKGVTKEVELEADLLGIGEKDMGEGPVEVAAFVLRTKVNRYDFGLEWNMELPSGKLLVGKEVTIEVNIEAVKA